MLAEQFNVLTVPCVDCTISFRCRGTANPDGALNSC
jgi:hypothetical protein